MPISATCRRSKTVRLNGGFTLLELMVVLALMTLAVGVVLPRLDVLVDGVGAASERETMVEAVASLGLLARSQARQILFDGDLSDLPGEIPSGWRVIPENGPIVFHASGACDGGKVRVLGRNRQFVYELAPPRCRATLID